MNLHMQFSSIGYVTSRSKQHDIFEVLILYYGLSFPTRHFIGPKRAIYSMIQWWYNCLKNIRITCISGALVVGEDYASTIKGLYEKKEYNLMQCPCAYHVNGRYLQVLPKVHYLICSQMWSLMCTSRLLMSPWNYFLFLYNILPVVCELITVHNIEKFQ